VIALLEVRELVDYDVIEYIQREMNESPIEENIIPWRTTPPIAPGIGDLDPII